MLVQVSSLFDLDDGCFWKLEKMSNKCAVPAITREHYRNDVFTAIDADMAARR